MGLKMLVAGVCVVAPLLAAADELNIKTGLWEITSTSRISGAPPLPDELRGQITPQQRAEMEEAFRKEAAKGPLTHIDRECITKEDLERPFEPADAQDCAYRITNTTRTTQEATLVCSGEYEGSGRLRVRTPTQETMSGSLELKLGEGEDVMTIKSQLKGRWLGPQCGDEEDTEPQDAHFDDEDESGEE